MNEPTVEQIALMAAATYSGGQHSPKWSVRVALQIWDQAVLQVLERKARKEKTDAQLV